MTAEQKAALTEPLKVDLKAALTVLRSVHRWVVLWAHQLVLQKADLTVDMTAGPKVGQTAELMAHPKVVHLALHWGHQKVVKTAHSKVLHWDHSWVGHLAV